MKKFLDIAMLVVNFIVLMMAFAIMCMELKDNASDGEFLSFVFFKVVAIAVIYFGMKKSARILKRLGIRL